MPSVDYISNAPPSVFAYPPALVDKKEEKKEKVETAVLSITAKQKKRDMDKKGEKSDEATAMDTVSTSILCGLYIYSTGVQDTDAQKATTADDDKDKATTTADKKDDAASASTKKEKEPDSEILHNPTRVVKAQVRVISIAAGSKLCSLLLLATVNFITKRFTIYTN
jgi:26S proteasome regulatory subunit N2